MSSLVALDESEALSGKLKAISLTIPDWHELAREVDSGDPIKTSALTLTIRPLDGEGSATSEHIVVSMGFDRSSTPEGIWGVVGNNTKNT